MMPTLAPGDRLLVVRLGRPRPGDLVALRDPDEPARLLVKRIKARGPAGVEVRGDNEAASRDSRVFGPVAAFPAARKSRLPLLPAGPGGPASTASASSSGTLDLHGPASRGHRPVARARVTADLESVPVGELRLRRDACQRAEVAFSYVRRVLQGELDIVAAELEARARGVRGDCGPARATICRRSWPARARTRRLNSTLTSPA